MDPTFILLDFETTGLDPQTSEIIEIGAIRVENLKATEHFHAFVRPKGEIPLPIVQLTRITPEMLSSERSIEEVIPSLLAFLGDHPIVAHNASLEQKFLNHFVAPHAGDRAFQVHNSIDPIAILFPDHASLSMEALRAWMGMDGSNAHRADQDCEDLLKILVQARDTMNLHRPFLRPLVREYLGPRQGSERWWWSWYFEAPLEGEFSLERETPPWLERPGRGDLRELRDEDLSKHSSPRPSLPAEKIREALNRPAPAHPTFRFRESQERMAQEIREAIESSQRVAIEAPTGTGKSIAYLVPVVMAARATGQPFVVSTHSKSLQDQLLEKDVPTVAELLEIPDLKATTVKGQENYVCLRKLHAEAEDFDPNAPLEERLALVYLLSFASVSRLAELDRLSHYLKIQWPSLSGLIERVRSHHTTTLGPNCRFYGICHFFDSARLAHQSDVVIANHSLVFRWPVHLPQIRDIVFDEAHHLEDQITEAYSAKLKEEELALNLERFCRTGSKRPSGDCLAIAKLMERHPADPAESANSEDSNEAGTPPLQKLVELTERIRSRMAELRMLIPGALRNQPGSSEGYEERVPFASPVVEGITNLAGSVEGMRGYLGIALERIESQGARAEPGLDLLKMHHARWDSYAQKLRKLLAREESNFLRLLYWDPREATWRATVSPIDVSALSGEFFESRASVVLTSATLTAGRGAGTADDHFVTRRIGLQPSRPLLSLPSPYRLEEQARVYLPNDVAQPGTPSHLDALIDFTERTTNLLGGKTLLLLTSNRRLKYAADVLRNRLSPLGITVFDSLSDRRAADQFKVTERALLIGSERYGEGLDIPGQALSCVIIEKINEAMTRGPLAEARKAKTKFALYDYDFPLRMMWLKQRVGRLVRSATDTGSVIVFDPRYNSWSKASRSRVDEALAPIPVLCGTREEILGWIEERMSAHAADPALETR